VFVHGLRGGKNSFIGDGFDWPKNMPAKISAGGIETRIDVFRLIYPAALTNWAQGSNPNFDDIVEKIIVALKPLRKKRYRSIGFVAHSLGGNIIASYLHAIKAEFGHPQRSQHGFVITLGTPYSGAHLAKLGQSLNWGGIMSGDLLESLKKDNLYLRMIRRFYEKTDGKSKRYDCRPVPLFVGYEKPVVSFMGFETFIVPRESAVGPIRNVIDEVDLKEFELSHVELAEPKSTNDVQYTWVLTKVKKAYQQLLDWPIIRYEKRETTVYDPYYLCSLIPFIDEDRAQLH